MADNLKPGARVRTANGGEGLVLSVRRSAVRVELRPLHIRRWIDVETITRNTTRNEATR